MDFKSGIIDKVQEGQLYEVFHHYDTKSEGLDWDQFKTFVFAVGMQFLITHYEDEIIEQLFDWDYEYNTVHFDDFIEWINDKCKFENTPEQFEKDMEVFDDDHNETAAITDVMRVMKNHEKMTDEEVSMFIKICNLGPKLTEEEEKADLASLKLPKKFSIKQAAESFYNK